MQHQGHNEYAGYVIPMSENNIIPPPPPPHPSTLQDMMGYPSVPSAAALQHQQTYGQPYQQYPYLSSDQLNQQSYQSPVTTGQYPHFQATNQIPAPPPNLSQPLPPPATRHNMPFHPPPPVNAPRPPTPLSAPLPPIPSAPLPPTYPMGTIQANIDKNSCKSDGMDDDIAYSPSHADVDNEETASSSMNVRATIQVEIRDEDIAYSPSKADSDCEAEPQTNRTQNNDQSVTNPKVEIDSKKRKITSSVGKLKRIAIRGFQDDVDDEVPVPKPVQTVSNNNMMSSPNPDMSEEKSLTLTQIEINVIMKTAQWAHKNPDKLEILMKSKSDDPVMKFLFDKTSPGHQFYQQELAKLKASQSAASVSVTLNEQIELARKQTLKLSQSVQSMTAVSKSINDDLTKVKRERNNRWGPPVTETSNSSSKPVQVKADPKMLAQIEEQKQLQLLEARIREAARVQGVLAMSADEEVAELHKERLRQYKELAERDDEKLRDTIDDAEAEIEGGTWEHRKRAKEMLKTASSSLGITISGSGKHHIADFLPKEELDKFLKKSSAAKSGSSFDERDDKNKITSDNIGYQLLSKSGWEEGKSLGSSNSGIAEPIAPAARITDTSGIGVKSTTEVEESDDNFDEYRKRMMLAYRFRPNPLNNPRRAYY